MRGVSGDDPEGGAGSGVPRLRREPQPTGGPGSRPPGFVAWRGQVAGGSGVPLPETAAWGPRRKSPRGGGERGPARNGTRWSRLARATERKSAPVGAPPAPRSGSGLPLTTCRCRQGHGGSGRRSGGQGSGDAAGAKRENHGTTRTHKRAAGTKKPTLFDIVRAPVARMG